MNLTDEELEKWKKMCAGKVVHATRNAALYALKLYKGLRVRHDVYKCPFCDKYHIGTRR